jgi:hypothetical protein
MFKSTKRTIAGLAALAAASLAIGFTAPKAEAARCVYGHNYQICFESDGYNRYGNQLWNLVLRNNHATEYMRVACNGSYATDWQSRGGLSQSEANYLAQYFCAI